MKRNVFLAIAVLLCAGGNSPAGEASITKLKSAIDQLNRGFETNNAEVVDRLLTPEHIAVTPYYGGPKSRAEQIRTLADHKFTEYTSGKMQIQLLNKETALITYPLTLKGSYQGKPVSPRNFAAAVWVLRDGNWQEAYYQETALSGK